MSELNSSQIDEGFKEVQNLICDFLVANAEQNYREDRWNYHKGTGGGITRVWESPIKEEGDINFVLEKGGVNFSSIVGENLPQSALDAHKIEGNHGFRACGVSLVIHPTNPFFPTIHMNIRYFEVDGTDQWWFGGGVDLTPNYVVDKNQIITFHKILKDLCDKHNQDYDQMKKECDEYFWLKHRNEARGIGGIFFDQMGSFHSSSHKSKREIFDFAVDLGRSFVPLYQPFFQYKSHPFSPDQREFQLLRRARYAEFNLLFDRGTKFGIQSGGRTESILMSMPAVVHWRYDWHPEKDSEEEKFMLFYLHPQNWINL